MTDYEKFKKLLALFVSHIEAIQAGKDNIPPLNKKCNAFKTDFSQTQYGNILVNISNQFNYGFATKTCYLEWERGTGVNINCIWNGDKTKIEKLQLQQCINGGQSQGQFEAPKMKVKVTDLDLFSANSPSANLKIFFDNFCKMYKLQMFNNMNIINLLANSKNLILTGAPGVGKTYKTAEIAVAIADSAFSDFSDRKKVMERYKALIADGQIAFTTFHQSLDYEEFVEGLKPDIDDDGSGTGSFSVKNGIFKNICARAEAANISGGQDNFADSWNKMQKAIIESTQEYKMKDSNCTVTINTQGNPTFNGSPVASYKTTYMKYKGKDTGLKYETYQNIVLNHLKEKFGLIDYKAGNKILSGNKNFVLIIDEINRGNISKIFGELITLLEKDKRIGEENEIAVTLPYSPNYKFGVPSNLYIIGTMNTADRSIGAIDYALRRRFAFVSLKSDRSVISNYDKYQSDTKTKAETLFDNIKSFIESNINEDLDADDLMVGHSYFLCETEDDLKRRLEYEIIPLLWEYQKDGILTCDRKTLKEKIAEWKNIAQ